MLRAHSKLITLFILLGSTDALVIHTLLGVHVVPTPWCQMSFLEGLLLSLGQMVSLLPEFKPFLS